MPSLRALALALSLLPTYVAAQETATDTTGFRRGQWGVQFGAGFGLANVGVLHFSSPHSAWMLQLDVGAEYLSGTQTTVGAVSDVDDRNVTFGAGIGRRFYQAPRHNVRSFVSVGAAGSLSDQKQTIGAATYTFTTSRAGLFFELGGGYWVTPNLSLGGTASVAGGLSHRVSDNSSTRISETGWFVSGVNVLLAVGLYF